MIITCLLCRFSELRLDALIGRVSGFCFRFIFLVVSEKKLLVNYMKPHHEERINQHAISKFTYWFRVYTSVRDATSEYCSNIDETSSCIIYLGKIRISLMSSLFKLILI